MVDKFSKKRRKPSETKFKLKMRTKWFLSGSYIRCSGKFMSFN